MLSSEPPVADKRWRVRLARGAEDLTSALALRSQCFRGGCKDDRDAFDARSLHVLIEDREGRLGGCFRLMVLPAAKIGLSYSAQFYDLSRAARLEGRIGDLGRFCIAPGPVDANLLRMAFGALAGLVDRAGVRLLTGCTSFPGTDATVHAAAFALLGARHSAPSDWMPGRIAPETAVFSKTVASSGTAPTMPVLLRSYLAMGARVGDHAVVDRDLDTLHVFTGLDVAQVPPTRIRALRALAAALPR